MPTVTFRSDDCGGASALCGPEYPCCDFESDAFLYAARVEGFADPCDPRFWRAPTGPNPVTGNWSCNETQVFDESGFVDDLRIDPTADPLTPGYWSERFSLETLGPCTAETTAELTRRCPPPGIFPRKTVPLGRNAERLASNVNIRRGLFSALGVQSRGWEACEKPLLQSAWAALRTNLDLVQWVLCLTEPLQRPPLDRVRDCVMRQLTRTDTGANAEVFDVFVPVDPLGGFTDARLRIELQSDTAYVFDNTLAFASFWDGTINIDGGSTWWGRVTEMFCSGDTRKQSCAALDVAGLVFHELLHACGASLGFRHGRNSSNGETPDFCDFTYVAGNTLRWALAARYQFDTEDAATELPCCSVRRIRDVFQAPFPDRPFVDFPMALADAC